MIPVSGPPFSNEVDERYVSSRLLGSGVVPLTLGSREWGGKSPVNKEKGPTGGGWTVGDGNGR